jgi:hypothetical protein
MPEQAISWVIYLMTIHGKTSGKNAVCEQSEWDALELDRPGYHKLIQAGITNEGEAERLARSKPDGSNQTMSSEIKSLRR